MATISLQEKEQLINISLNFELKSEFKKIELTKFWIMLVEEFPEISLKALKLLIRFPTITYLCEKTFSLYAATKTKYRNRLNAETDLFLQMTSVEPQFKH